jgi:putative transposase
MGEDKDAPGVGNVIRIDEERIRDHLGRIVRGTVEDTLNGLLDAEADRLCGATRYERTAARRDTRAGSCRRQLHTRAGEVTLKVPKLRRQAFETALIERYRRREPRSRRRWSRCTWRACPCAGSRTSPRRCGAPASALGRSRG